MNFDFGTLMSIGPELWPMLPRIEAAAKYLQKIETDPAVKQAVGTAVKYLDDPEAKAVLQTVLDVVAIINKVQAAPAFGGIGTQAGGGIGS